MLDGLQATYSSGTWGLAYAAVADCFREVDVKGSHSGMNKRSSLAFEGNIVDFHPPLCT